MKTQSLSKQIQREIKAHPVKAGVLALALLVALWFWAPLVIGWVSGPQAKKPAVAAAPSASGAVAAAAPVAANPAKPQWNPNWREMEDWVRSAHATRPAASSDNTRDPFRKVAPAAVAAEVVQPTAPKIDPESLGLELSSTLIGQRQSIAMINGRAYVLPHAGTAGNRRPVAITVKVQDQTYQFMLLAIDPHHVQLEHAGQLINVRVKDKPLHEKMIELNEKSTFEIHGRVSYP